MSVDCSMTTPAALRLLVPRARVALTPVARRLFDGLTGELTAWHEAHTAAEHARRDADLELVRAWAQADRVIYSLEAKVAPAQQVRVALGALLADPAVKTAIGAKRWDYFHAKYLGVSAGLQEPVEQGSTDSEVAA